MNKITTDELLDLIKFAIDSMHNDLNNRSKLRNCQKYQPEGFNTK